jgi:mycothiol synthase
MAKQLQMIWPETRLAQRPEWQMPAEYRLRNFREGDEAAYLELMHCAGFTEWNEDNLNAVVQNAVPGGIIFAEHIASASLAATAMGWYKPSLLFPDAYEMGWVAAKPTHRGKGLGQIVTAAATRVLLDYGAGLIYLQTDDWRLPAIKGYLKLGYVPVYHQPDMKGRWQEVFLKLDLKMEDYAGVEINMEKDGIGEE